MDDNHLAGLARDIGQLHHELQEIRRTARVLGVVVAAGLAATLATAVVVALMLIAR